VTAAVPDARLLIAGDGSRRATLEDDIRSRRLRGVRLLGRIDDVSLVRLFQAGTCSVIPSRALEGFGLVALESLACGTPPIVTDVGGLPDSVRALDSSLIVASEDAGALAARIVAAAGGALPDRADCRAHAEGFSWSASVARHEALYDDVYEEARG